MVRKSAVVRLDDFGTLPFNPDAWKLDGGHAFGSLSTWKASRSVLFAVLAILYRIEAAEVEVRFNVFDIK